MSQATLKHTDKKLYNNILTTLSSLTIIMDLSKINIDSRHLIHLSRYILELRASQRCLYMVTYIKSNAAEATFACKASRASAKDTAVVVLQPRERDKNVGVACGLAPP